MWPTLSAFWRGTSYDILKFDIVPLYIFFLFYMYMSYNIIYIIFQQNENEGKDISSSKDICKWYCHEWLSVTVDGLSKSTGLIAPKSYSVNGNAIYFVRSPESHRWTFSHQFSFLN